MTVMRVAVAIVVVAMHMRVVAVNMRVIAEAGVALRRLRASAERRGTEALTGLGCKLGPCRVEATSNNAREYLVGCEGQGILIKVGVAVSVGRLIGGGSNGNLVGLHKKEHGGPGEMEGNPAGEGKGKCVVDEDAAQDLAEEGAGGIRVGGINEVGVGAEV